MDQISSDSKKTYQNSELSRLVRGVVQNKTTTASSSHKTSNKSNNNSDNSNNNSNKQKDSTEDSADITYQKGDSLSFTHEEQSLKSTSIDSLENSASSSFTERTTPGAIDTAKLANMFAQILTFSKDCPGSTSACGAAGSLFLQQEERVQDTSKHYYTQYAKEYNFYDRRSHLAYESSPTNRRQGSLAIASSSSLFESTASSSSLSIRPSPHTSSAGGSRSKPSPHTHSQWDRYRMFSPRSNSIVIDLAPDHLFPSSGIKDPLCYKSGLDGGELATLWEFCLDNVLCYTLHRQKISKFLSPRRVAYLYGQRGVGRLSTTLAFCSRWDFNLLYVSPNIYVKGMLTEILSKAQSRSFQPCIIYFDRADTMLNDASRRQELSYFLKQLDFTKDNVWVFISASVEPLALPQFLQETLKTSGEVLFIGVTLCKTERKHFFYRIFTRFAESTDASRSSFTLAYNRHHRPSSSKNTNPFLPHSSSYSSIQDKAAIPPAFGSIAWTQALDRFSYASEYCTFSEMYEFIHFLFEVKLKESMVSWRFTRETPSSDGYDISANDLIPSAMDVERVLKSMSISKHTECTFCISTRDVKEDHLRFKAGFLNYLQRADLFKSGYQLNKLALPLDTTKPKLEVHTDKSKNNGYYSDSFDVLNTAHFSSPTNSSSLFQSMPASTLSSLRKSTSQLTINKNYAIHSPKRKRTSPSHLL